MPEWKKEIKARLADSGLEPVREAEIIEELSQHLEDRYRELLADYDTKAEAYRLTLDELNDVNIPGTRSKQIKRWPANEIVILGTTRRASVMTDLWQDISFGIRLLRKNFGFTLIAVLSLALGIGANTAIFQLLDSIRLRSLPIKDAHELAEVKLKDTAGVRGNVRSWRPALTNPIWEHIRGEQQAFSGIFAWGRDSFNLATGGEARYAKVLWVSGNFFEVLSIEPAMGRLFKDVDDRRGCSSAGAVISYSFWQREFGGDPSIIGKQITLENSFLEIIGVTPASFFGLEVGQTFDVALPICSEAIFRGQASQLDVGTTWWLTVMGRLKEGWNLEQATSHLESISPGLFEATLPADYPSISVNDYKASRLEVASAGSGVSQLRESYTAPLWLLLAVAGLVLLIACANLANLMLARSSAREREIAIRLALGASRSRLVRQLLVESLLLGSIGAALGVLLAQSLSRFLVSYMSSQDNPLFVDLHLDWGVLAFTAALAILASILFGLAPALRSTRIEPGVVMKAGSRGLTASRERFWLRRALVVSQVALSLILVVTAFVFSRSLSNLMTIDVGFQRKGVLITGVDISPLNLPRERRQSFKSELIDKVRAIPGVEYASTANITPISGNSWGSRVWIDGADSSQMTGTAFSRISQDYFKTLGTPLLSGRDFDDRDTATSQKVAIVNETFARQFLDGANPVGKSFWVEKTPYDPETLYQIVGFVKDTKYEDIREDFLPIAFFAASQTPRPGQYDQLLIRSSGPLTGIVASTKRTIAEISPDININFQGLEEQIDGSLMRERLMATLSGFFGGLALLLACIGLYGIISYSVASRISEIGIRMALGAQPRNVLNMILREALLMVLIGVAIGVPVIFATSNWLSSLLFGLTSSDPLSISLAVLLMIAVSVLACWLPARRASKVDPIEALRYE